MDQVKPLAKSLTETALRAWFNEARQASWETPADVKAQYATASFLAGNRVVFND